MTTVYLINNSLTINNLVFPSKESLEQKREKRILSVEGEEASKKLVNLTYLKDIQYIYTSSYVMSMQTAKYLAKYLEVDMQITDSLGERIIGELGDKRIRMVNEIQESDFNYKLKNGESLNEVKNRAYIFLMKLLQEKEGKKIALFTHNVLITCLLSCWCEKGFNLDNRLILNYENKAIIDGTWDGINIIELEFEDNKLVNINRKK